MWNVCFYSFPWFFTLQISNFGFLCFNKVTLERPWTCVAWCPFGWPFTHPLSELQKGQKKASKSHWNICNTITNDSSITTNRWNMIKPIQKTNAAVQNITLNWKTVHSQATATIRGMYFTIICNMASSFFVFVQTSKDRSSKQNKRKKTLFHTFSFQITFYFPLKHLKASSPFGSSVEVLRPEPHHLGLPGQRLVELWDPAQPLGLGAAAEALEGAGHPGVARKGKGGTSKRWGYQKHSKNRELEE